MKKMFKAGISAVFFAFAVLLTVTCAQAQTPERIEPIKAGEAKNINFVLEPNATKKYVINLVKDTKLKIVYEMPAVDGDASKLTQPLAAPVDNSYTSYAGADAPRTPPTAPPTTFGWELHEKTQKVAFGSNARDVVDKLIVWADREKFTNIPANGDYVVTVKCIAQSKCENLIRFEVYNEIPIPQTNTP